METTDDREPSTAEAARESGDSPEGAPAKGHRRTAIDAKGMERPRFLLDFPDDPALERLISAFEAGNFALIRRDAEGLARSTSDPEVRKAALELRRRIDPDPLAKYLIAISVALLVVLTVWAYRGGAH